jgi:hypothetical protein
MVALQIVLLASIGLLGFMVLGWLLRPRISPATVTDQIVSVTHSLESELTNALAATGKADVANVRNEATALMFVVSAWGVQIGGGGHMLRQDQCARLSVLYEQRLLGMPSAAERRSFVNEHYTSYNADPEEALDLKRSDRPAILRAAAELAVDRFIIRSSIAVSERQRQALIVALESSLVAAKAAWARSIALYRLT